ncbi:Y-family DNA polymerase [Hymenobacter lutimineralis]
MSRSDEAKQLGFAMGEAYFQARGRLREHGVTVFSSNYPLYGDMSRRVMTILSQFSPEVEVYSIDESFLNLEGLRYCAPEGLQAYAHRIRHTVRQQTGIPTAIGIAPTKVLAKLANRLARQLPETERVCLLATLEQQRAALASTPVENVWGIGRRYAAKLRLHQVGTAAELAAMPEAWVRRHLGGVAGVRLWRELRGEKTLSWHGENLLPEEGEKTELARPRHSVICTRSFGKPQTALGPLQEAIATHVGRAAEKLRQQQRVAHLLTVLLGRDRYTGEPGPYTLSTVVPLLVATNDTLSLTKAALRGLRQLRQPGVAYTRAGVLLTGLEPAGQPQLSLFSAGETEQSAALMSTFDALNARFGRGTVRLAASGLDPSAFRSPAYTTDWQQLWHI